MIKPCNCLVGWVTKSEMNMWISINENQGEIVGIEKMLKQDMVK